MPETVCDKLDGTEFTRVADAHLGLFLILCLPLILASYYWYKDLSPFSAPQRFNVLFNQVAGLQSDAAVYLNGIHVGQVEKISYRKQPPHIVAKLRVNRQPMLIPEGSTFNIYSNNVVGAKYIDITVPDKQEQADRRAILNEQSIVVGNDPSRPEVLLSDITNDLNGVDFNHIEQHIRREANKISKITDKVSVASEKLQPVIDRTLSLEANIDTLTENVRTVTKKLDKIIDDSTLASDLQTTAREAGEAIKHIDLAARQVNQMLDKKHPLIHMIFARPGHVKREEAE